MWYILIVLILVFEITISFVAPYFPNLTIDAVNAGTIASTGVNIVTEVDSIVDVVDVAISAPQMFGALMGFQIHGAELLSALFYILDIILVLCLIRLIRDGG